MPKYLKGLTTPVMAIVTALLAGAFILMFSGYDVGQAYVALFKGAFGNMNNLAETLLKAIPLIFTGLAVAFSFQCRAFNIGAEGQFYAGAIVAAWLGVSLGHLHFIILIPLLVLLAGIGGGLLGGFVGWLKAKVGASEVVTTVMLNEVMIYLNSYLITGPLQEPERLRPATADISVSARLPHIIAGTRLHLGIMFAIALAVATYLILYRTTFGFHVRNVGANPRAAECTGVNVRRMVVLSMALSGAIAGIGGCLEVLGVTWKLYQYFSPGYGYDGIAVALLAKTNPLGTVLSALLIGALRSGSNMMQRRADIPAEVGSVLQALVIFSVIVYSAYEMEIWRWFMPRVNRRSKGEESKVSVS